MSSDTAKLALEAGQNATVDAKGRDIVSVVAVVPMLWRSFIYAWTRLISLQSVLPLRSFLTLSS